MSYFNGQLVTVVFQCILITLCIIKKTLVKS